MAKRIKPNDIIVEGKVALVKSLKNQSGYPHNLTEEQVVRLIYFFGSRRASSKALGGAGITTRDFTTAEKMFLRQAFEWYGFVWQEDPKERRKAYRALILRFKDLTGFLKSHPAFITTDIHRALKECGYEGVLRNIVMVVDEHRNIVPRIMGGAKQNAMPLAKAETLMWEFQNIAMDKMMEIVRSISIEDIKKANLGGKSKALRDLGAMLHMQRQASKNPNMTLINLNVNTADPNQKLQSYNAYIQKNRENS